MAIVTSKVSGLFIMEFEAKAPSNSKTFCCVFGCSSKAKRNRTLSFHVFPPQGKRKVYIINKLGSLEKIDIHKAWILNLKMSKVPSKYMKVCSLHFTSDDFKPMKSDKYHNNYLRWNAIPSVNLPEGSIPCKIPKHFDIETKCMEDIISAHNPLEQEIKQEVDLDDNTGYTENEKEVPEALLSVYTMTGEDDVKIEINEQQNEWDMTNMY